MTQKLAFGLIGQVGDAVMSTVALRQLKKECPDSEIVFTIGQKYAHILELFRGLPEISDVHAWDSHEPWPSEPDIEYIRKEKFNHVFHPLPTHVTSDWYNRYHYTEETAMMLGLQKPTDLQCSLGYRPKKLAGLDKTIVLSLFASGNQLSKTMRLDDMRDMVARLRGMGYECVQIGSSDLPIEGARQAQTSSIYEAVDILTSARMQISIDTAFAWIGSAYSVPVVGLYGINYPDMPLIRVCSHNPVNKNALYLNRPSVKDIGVDEIINATSTILS